MIGFLLSLGVISVMLWLGYKVTGAIFKACLWLFLFLPLVFCLWGIGIILCSTIILIPVGVIIFSIGSKLLFQSW